MKTISFLLASVCFTFILSFSGCSDDSSPTYTTAPPSTDSLMYSFDSLVVYSDNTIQTNAYYLYLDTCKITKFRIQCSLTTNDTTSILDSAHSISITSLTNNGDTSNGAYYNLKIGSNINSNINNAINLTITTPYRLVGSVYLSFVNFPHNRGRYIKAKNFKLYKIN
jgi:hypothetical protein